MAASTGADLAHALHTAFRDVLRQQAENKLSADVILDGLMLFVGRTLAMISSSAQLTAEQETDFLATFAHNLRNAVEGAHHLYDEQQ